MFSFVFFSFLFCTFSCSKLSVPVKHCDSWIYCKTKWKLLKCKKRKKQCWELLRPFARGVWPVSNFAQQHATACNRVCKRTQHVTSNIVIFLDFHSTKQGLPMVDFGHMVLTKIKCIPIVIHLSKKYCTPLGIHYSMWSKHGGTGSVFPTFCTHIEGGKNTASFLFREWTQQHKHEASS